MLQKQGFEHRQWRVGRTAGLTGPHLADQDGKTVPIDQTGNPLQPLVAPETRRKQSLNETVLRHADSPPHKRK